MRCSVLLLLLCYCACAEILVRNKTEESTGICVGGIKQEKVLLCHYGGFIPPSALDPCLCSHVVLTDWTLEDDLTLHHSQFGDLDFVKDLKSENSNLKVLLMMGDSVNGSVLARAAANPQEASQLAEGLADFLVQHHLDGIDVQWDPALEARKNNFTTLLKILRRSLDKLSSEASKADERSTIIVSIAKKYNQLSEGYNFPSLSKFVDYFYLPAYNFTNTENHEAMHHSRLLGSDAMNADSLLDLVIGLHVPAKKIVLGIPAFGLYYHLVDDRDGEKTTPAANGSIRTIGYQQICKALSKGNWSVRWDNDKTAPFASKRFTWVGYDDPASVRIKSKYALLRNLAGIGLWRIDQEDFNGTCGKGRFPLLTAARTIYDELINADKGRVMRSLAADIEPVGAPSESQPVTSSRPPSGSPFRITSIVDRSGQIQVITDNSQTNMVCTRPGYYRNADDCTHFYRCIKFNHFKDDFTIFEYSCPPGLVFDEKWEVCNWPSATAPCGGSSEILPVPRNKFLCPAEGYFTDPENCRWFYKCSDHNGDGTLTAYEFRCPFDLAFDETKILCNWRWLVPSCGNSGHQHARPPIGPLKPTRPGHSLDTGSQFNDNDHLFDGNYPNGSPGPDGPFPNGSPGPDGPFPNGSPGPDGPFPEGSTGPTGPFNGDGKYSNGPDGPNGPFPEGFSGPDGPFPEGSSGPDGPFPEGPSGPGGSGRPNEFGGSTRPIGFQGPKEATRFHTSSGSGGFPATSNFNRNQVTAGPQGNLGTIQSHGLPGSLGTPSIGGIGVTATPHRVSGAPAPGRFQGTSGISGRFPSTAGPHGTSGSSGPQRIPNLGNSGGFEGSSESGEFQGTPGGFQGSVGGHGSQGGSPHGISNQGNTNTFGGASASGGFQGTAGPGGFQGTARPGGFQGAGGPGGFQGAGGPGGFQGAGGPGGFQGAGRPGGFQGAGGSEGLQGAGGPGGFQGAGGPGGFQGAGGSEGLQGAGGPGGFQGAGGPGGFQGAGRPGGFQGAGGSEGLQGAGGPGGFQGTAGPGGFQGTAKPGGFQGAGGPGGFQGAGGPGGFQGAGGPGGLQGAGGPGGFQGTVGPGGFHGAGGPGGFQEPGGLGGFQGTARPGGFQGTTGRGGTQVTKPHGVQGSTVPRFQGTHSTDVQFGDRHSQGTRRPNGLGSPTQIGVFDLTETADDLRGPKQPGRVDGQNTRGTGGSKFTPVEGINRFSSRKPSGPLTPGDHSNGAVSPHPSVIDIHHGNQLTSGVTPPIKDNKISFVTPPSDFKTQSSRQPHGPVTNSQGHSSVGPLGTKPLIPQHGFTPAGVGPGSVTVGQNSFGVSNVEGRIPSSHGATAFPQENELDRFNIITRRPSGYEDRPPGFIPGVIIGNSRCETELGVNGEGQNYGSIEVGKNRKNFNTIPQNKRGRPSHLLNSQDIDQFSGGINNPQNSVQVGHSVQKGFSHLNTQSSSGFSNQHSEEKFSSSAEGSDFSNQRNANNRNIHSTSDFHRGDGLHGSKTGLHGSGSFSQHSGDSSGSLSHSGISNKQQVVKTGNTAADVKSKKILESDLGKIIVSTSLKAEGEGTMKISVSTQATIMDNSSGGISPNGVTSPVVNSKEIVKHISNGNRDSNIFVSPQHPSHLGNDKTSVTGLGINNFDNKDQGSLSGGRVHVTSNGQTGSLVNRVTLAHSIGASVDLTAEDDGFGTVGDGTFSKRNKGKGGSSQDKSPTKSHSQTGNVHGVNQENFIANTHEPNLFLSTLPVDSSPSGFKGSSINFIPTTTTFHSPEGSLAFTTPASNLIEKLPVLTISGISDNNVNNGIGTNVGGRGSGGRLVGSEGDDPLPGRWGALLNGTSYVGPVSCERAGLFRHPDDCSLFYECYWDRWLNRYTIHYFECPVRLAFDYSILGCNWPLRGPPCHVQ